MMIRLKKSHLVKRRTIHDTLICYTDEKEFVSTVTSMSRCGYSVTISTLPSPSNAATNRGRSSKMHHIIASMFKHVYPGSLQFLILGRHNVQLWAVGAMEHVDFRRMVGFSSGLQVTSCIQKCEKRVDIYWRGFNGQHNILRMLWVIHLAIKKSIPRKIKLCGITAHCKDLRDEMGSTIIRSLL
jgi:hypothetical protein